MDALRIEGGAPLRGEIEVSGSKNASLPIMAAALLAPGVSKLHGVPKLADIHTMGQLLTAMGVTVTREGSTLSLDGSEVRSFEAPYDLVRTMRASILVLGPLLARFGQARVSLPGGCAIGARPIDQHLKALEKLGATVTLEHGYVVATAPKLRGAEITFDVPTVGGTENLLLASSLAEGTTVLNNAALEPEIVDLARVLTLMGADIQGAGTSRIVVHGNQQLQPFDHRVIPDRIEFGTFLVAGALAGDGLLVRGGIPEHQRHLLDALAEAGAELDERPDGVRVARGTRRRPLQIVTEPYPGFPTDMQAQLMALLTLAQGESVISERIFENRFMHVAELHRLGANIRVEGGRATIVGVPRLSGTTVMATDLRASACLVLAGLIAEGETVVRRIYHLDRGYEDIGEKLGKVGARIERFKES